VVRRRWRLNGRDHRLEPGAYRWYVWPRVDGRRRAKANVQAKLLVLGLARRDPASECAALAHRLAGSVSSVSCLRDVLI
jgi:hypothetical protein